MLQTLKKWARKTFLSPSLPEDHKQNLEKILMESDFGRQTTQAILHRLEKESLSQENLEERLKSILVELATPLQTPLPLPEDNPVVYTLCGVNGSGKTTSLGKLAYYLTDLSYPLGVVGGDTFRESAGLQLETLLKDLSPDLKIGQPKEDPGSVVFKGLEAFLPRKKAILIDTSGRLHTHKPLMESLKKIHGVVEKFKKSFDFKTCNLLIIDSHTGQNALNQGALFQEYLPIHGLIMTKMDGSAKGGSLFQVARTLNLPIFGLGSGESLKDFQPFSPKAYVDKIFQ